MPYFIKLPFAEETSFPSICPYCFKEEVQRFIKVTKTEYKPLFSKEEVEKKTIQLPLCSDCIGRGHQYIFFAVLIYLTLIVFIVGLFMFEPLMQLSWKERGIYLSGGLLMFFLTLRFKKRHLKRFRVKFVTPESYTVVTPNKEYAYALAQRNHTKVVKKWFLLKPL